MNPPPPGRPPEIPPALVTPDKVESSIGTLEFKDGAPSAETVADFTRGLDAFLNSYGGASAYAICQGFASIGARGFQGGRYWAELPAPHNARDGGGHTKRLWEMSDVADVLEAWEANQR